MYISKVIKGTRTYYMVVVGNKDRNGKLVYSSELTNINVVNALLGCGIKMYDHKKKED